MMNDMKKQPCMIGTWAWGNGQNGSRMVFGKKYDVSQLQETFQRAVHCGFIMWDTAEVYGHGSSEQLLGECIRTIEHPDQLYISTKHFPGKQFRKGAMQNSLSGSNKRLGIDAPDIYWIHVPNNLTSNLKEAIKLVKQHEIQSIGLSNVSLDEIIMAKKLLKAEGLVIGGIQNHYSLLSRAKDQEEIIAWCKENNVKYFAYMVLEQGALSGHYDEKHSFPLFSMRGFAFGRRKFRKISPLLDYEKKLAEKYGIDSAQIPVLWAIAKGTIPIIGLTKPQYVDELAKALELHLTKDEITRLETIAGTTGVYCKGSWEPHK